MVGRASPGFGREDKKEIDGAGRSRGRKVSVCFSMLQNWNIFIG